MDTKRIGLIGATGIMAIALLGGIYLTAQGIAVPAWLTAILMALGWAAKSPLDAADDKGKGGPPAPPLPVLLLCFGLAASSMTACTWLQRGRHAADIAAILACISGEAAAGKGPAEIAIKCGLENADAVIDLVTKSQGVAAAAPKMAKPAASSSASGSK
jgi:hypothetical protein